METLIMHPDNEDQLDALKAIAKAFKIAYDTEKLTDRKKAIELYGQDTVEAIEQGEADIKASRVTRIKDVKNIWESIL